MTSQADLQMEITVSRMLRVGVTTAALVVLAGATLYLLRDHGTAPDYRHFHGIPIPADKFAPVLQGVRRLDSRSIIHLGILILVATPIMRVAFCLYSFARQKDKIYVLVSGIVLAVLLYSFFRP
ncbi:MAG TPA: DUF1634 domain-containing protein [Acidobacteriaceae bacterium]|nr:DUF1634 domain-containing protein [Acidobacteriaceae bacterium]